MIQKMKLLLTFISIVIAGMVTNVSAATYTIDAAHTTIGFAVKHLVVSTTRGSFTDSVGDITFDKDDLDTFKANITIQVNSINTNNEKRDDHLKSGDFFDAEKHPTITFMGKKISGSDGNYTILGDLTIRGMTKEIALPVEISGPVKNPFGGTVMGIAGEIVINRQDYGVSWNKALDTGGFVVDDKVKLVIEIEAHNK